MARTLGIARRRTRCVYCGVRIPGVDQLGHTTDRERDRRRRIAARLACGRHLDLPQHDPAYEYLFPPLSEAELTAAASKRNPDGTAPLSAWVAGLELGEQERMKAAG